MTIRPPDSPRWTYPDRGLAPGPLEVHEAIFEAPHGPRMTLVAPSRDALIAMGAQADAYFGLLRPLQSGEAPNNHALDDAVRCGVGALRDLLRGHDALDVMTMLRQYMIPPDLALWRESGSTLLDSWAAADVVALVLLGLGLPSRDPNCHGNTASIVPRLIENAATIVQLAAITGMVELSSERDRLPSRESMSTLAWRLASHETSVRGRQYPLVAAAINERILRTAQTDAAFREFLGFTYDYVLAVREAVIDTVGNAFDAVLKELHSAAEAGGPPSTGAAEAARLLFEVPSQIHLVTPAQIAHEAGVDLNAATAVLDAFSTRPDGRTPEDLVRDFCDGRNPTSGKAILHAPGRGYLPLPGAMALDEIRRICEASLKGTAVWTRYGRARDRAVEGLVTDTVAALFRGKGSTYRNLRYRHAPNDHDLSSTSTTHRMAPITETDGLVLLDGVALCIEVKAGDFRPKSRQGGVAQLHGDLSKNVQEAAEQADRLRSIIALHRGLWLDNGDWLDLQEVDEIYSVVVCLDDLGPLALATSELVQAGLLPQSQLPWVVSVHDLIVFQHVLDRPEHFLTYLRRRTNRDAAMWIAGTDELDILMWFVSGGFYFRADPDRLFARYPQSKPPTEKQRRGYTQQGQTVVGTFTDPLDAYYYFEDGTSSRSADCPRREPMVPLLQIIFDSMAARSSPGWLRAAADADGYSSEAQTAIVRNIEATLSASAHDGSFHTFATGDFDDTGRWMYIFAGGADTATNRERLRQYLRAKKHQVRADRALGVLLAPDGQPRLTMWLAYKPTDDPELDALVESMRLIPPDRARSAPPPRVKKRARGRRKRRR